MRKVVALICGLIPTLTHAQSACPTAADLSKGIRVDRSNGFTEVVRAGGQGIVSVEGFIDRELEYTLELADGLQLLSYSGNVGPSPITDDTMFYDYGVPNDDLPWPTPNGRWQSAVTVTAFSGTYSEPQLYAYGPQEQITIGTCSYDMISVTIAYQNDANYIETVQFMPELGFGVLVRQGDDSVAPTVFTIDRIGLARQ